MKNIIIVIVIVGVLIAVYAFKNQKVNFELDSEYGIQFYKGSWEEVLKTAKKENKLIFVDVYATWCGPCKMLKATTFSSKNVGEFYNERFINVAIDGETPEGRTIAQKYKVRAYPTLLFIDENEQIVAKTQGYHNAKQLISVGNDVLAKK